MTLHGTSFRLCGALIAAALAWSAPAAAQSQTLTNPQTKAKPVPKPVAKPAARLSDQPGDSYGLVDFGFTTKSWGGLEGFLKGEAVFGDDASGVTGRLGVRWRW